MAGFAGGLRLSRQMWTALGMRFLFKFACHICSAGAVQSGTLSASWLQVPHSKKPAIIPTSKSEETTTIDTIWLRQQQQIAGKYLGRRLSLARNGSCQLAKRSLLLLLLLLAIECRSAAAAAAGAAAARGAFSQTYFYLWPPQKKKYLQ